MKKYKITVDGQTYEVEVEDMGCSTNASPVAAPVAAQAAPAPTVTASAPAPKAPTAAPAASASSASGTKLPAPMPGTILSVAVAVGDEVKKGQVLMVLEAMKMENEIVAPDAGKVEAIFVSKGSSVNAGDPMISFI